MTVPILHTYWRSSCSYRVRIALHHKRVAFEPVFVDLLDGAQASPEFRARNPTGYVPALELDGRTYGESIAILELLEERFPERPLLPSTPHDRARVRALVQIVASGIQPLQNLNVMRRVSAVRDEQVAFAVHYNERGLHAIEDLLGSFEAEGIRGPFAYGGEFGMADVVLVPQVYSAKRFGLDLGRFPRVSRAYESSLALDAVKRAAPEAQPDAPPG